MNKIKNSTDILRAAKQLLIDVGWVKGRSTKRDKSGKIIGYCATGAVSNVANGNLNNSLFPQRDRAIARLNKASGNKYLSVVGFNDHPHTSKKQILAVFDRAINSTKRKSKKGGKR